MTVLETMGNPNFIESHFFLDISNMGMHNFKAKWFFLQKGPVISVIACYYVNHSLLPVLSYCSDVKYVEIIDNKLVLYVEEIIQTCW